MRGWGTAKGPQTGAASLPGTWISLAAAPVANQSNKSAPMSLTLGSSPAGFHPSNVFGMSNTRSAQPNPNGALGVAFPSGFSDRSVRALERGGGVISIGGSAVSLYRSTCDESTKRSPEASRTIHLEDVLGSPHKESDVL